MLPHLRHHGDRQALGVDAVEARRDQEIAFLYIYVERDILERAPVELALEQPFLPVPLDPHGDGVVAQDDDVPAVLHHSVNQITCLNEHLVGTNIFPQGRPPESQPGRVVGLKDGCDWLLAGKEKEFIDRWWAAEKHIPDGIVAGSTLWEQVSKPLEKAEVSYPFEGLNKLTYGIRKGELVTVTAGSGLGKSQFLRELIWHILCKTQDNIGLMFLEESVRKTGTSIMSLAANKPLHLPDCDATMEEKRAAFDVTLGTDRLYMFDHFGSTDIQNIVKRTEEFANAFGCGYVFLDHVSIVVSSQQNGDERKALDTIMTELRTLVQRTGISLVLVSHLKRPDGGKGHEEGVATTLAQLRGSGSIAQLSDMVLGLERNGQADDEKERNTTKVRVLKNRFSGLTGHACNLVYSKYTGRMVETEDEKL